MYLRWLIGGSRLFSEHLWTAQKPDVLTGKGISDAEWMKVNLAFQFPIDTAEYPQDPPRFGGTAAELTKFWHALQRKFKAGQPVDTGPPP